jgi:uncharacterized membrane protein YgcG
MAAALMTMLLLSYAAPVAFGQGDQLSYVERAEGQHVFDGAKVLDPDIVETLDAQLRARSEQTGIDIVIYTRELSPPGARGPARDDAAGVVAAWDVGGENAQGAAMVLRINNTGGRARAGVALASGLADTVDVAALDTEVEGDVRPLLVSKDWDEAVASAVVALVAGTGAGDREVVVPVASDSPEATPIAPRLPAQGGRDLGSAPPAGPSYPDFVADVRVYDWAEILDPATERSLEDTIAGIEERTGAQVVVYSQVKPEADTPDDAERDAIGLIDQWGIGRAGFDDGLVILYDLSLDRLHGQVQLYAAPGYAAAYLTNDQRQAIFEQDMLPFLREADFDGATLAAMARIDETATADHARNLQLARQVDAAAGLVLAPLLLIGLVGWAGWSWLRYGRDPEYLDDASILMPAPPPGMSPAAAAVIMDGRSKRRALTTALVDLAARGEISFRQAEDDQDEVDLDITVPDQRDARLARNRRHPLGPAEAYALSQLKDLGGTKRTIASKDMPDVSEAVGGFDERIEQLVADQGWYREGPDESISRWSLRAGAVLILGIAGIFFGLNLPSNGLLLVGVALLASAIAMFIIARVMPQRTMEGARMFAQLAAYRRTLSKTLEQARTMDQVVSSGALPWAETPDQVVVWSYALGLHEEAEDVLERSLEDVRTGGASPTRTYFPLWFAIGPRTGARTSSAAKTPTAGLFSGGVVPDFTSMTAALSTIGSAPSSSGSGGGGGGFGGGSSGGGGGGAGGGF